MEKPRNPNELTEKLGYRFNDQALLQQAFRHASYVNEHPGGRLQDNERLEFLGDAVLDLAVSHLLMMSFPGAEEGPLSKFRAAMVGESGLHQVAFSLGLGDYIVLGKGEEQSGGRDKPSILADTLEALMGALYLDAGFVRTLDIVQALFGPLLEPAVSGEMTQDFKSLLQEYTQQGYKALPVYHLTGEEGPPHDRTFSVAVSLGGKTIAEGHGKSKKEAEQAVAKLAYEILK